MESLDRLVRGGAAGKTRQLGLVARRRDDEAALAAGDLHGLRPVGQRLLAEADDERLGALALTPRCEHAAGIERAAAPGRLAALDQLDRGAAAGELVSHGEAGDAGADHAHGRASSVSRK